MFGQITIEQWQKHPSFRKELQDLVNHPAFQAAYGIVLAQGLKTKALPPTDPLHWAGLMGQRKEGYLEALDNFIALTETPADKPRDAKAWTSNQSAQKQPPQTET